MLSLFPAFLRPSVMPPSSCSPSPPGSRRDVLAEGGGGLGCFHPGDEGTPWWQREALCPQQVQLPILTQG